MNGLNRVILVGTLGQNPKANTTRDGKPFTTLRLATNRFWKNKDGQLEQRTDWHSVHVWGKQGQLCQEYLKKGQPVCIEGHISTSETTEEDGKKKWSTFINADEVNFLPSKQDIPH